MGAERGAPVGGAATQPLKRGGNLEDLVTEKGVRSDGTWAGAKLPAESPAEQRKHQGMVGTSDPILLTGCGISPGPWLSSDQNHRLPSWEFGSPGKQLSPEAHRRVGEEWQEVLSLEDSCRSVAV